MVPERARTGCTQKIQGKKARQDQGSLVMGKLFSSAVFFSVHTCRPPRFRRHPDPHHIYISGLHPPPDCGASQVCRQPSNSWQPGFWGVQIIRSPRFDSAPDSTPPQILCRGSSGSTSHQISPHPRFLNSSDSTSHQAWGNPRFSCRSDSTPHQI